MLYSCHLETTQCPDGQIKSKIYPYLLLLQTDRCPGRHNHVGSQPKLRLDTFDRGVVELDLTQDLSESWSGSTTTAHEKKLQCEYKILI